MVDRRTILKGIPLAVGAALASPSQLFGETASVKKGPRRVIFFMQNHSFHESHCTPAGLKHGDALSKGTLPEHINPLEPYKKLVNVVTGLHGRHVSPAHSAFYGALGGYRKSKVTPIDITVDAVLAEMLPQGPIPHLCIGMEDFTKMRNRPIFYGTTATGPGKPVAGICHPEMLYQAVFGGAAKDKAARLKFERSTETILRIEQISKKYEGRIPKKSHGLYSTYAEGCREVSRIRQKLSGMADHLAKYMPKYDKRFTAPEFETEWHTAIMDVAIAAMQANVTNVLTVANGCVGVGGSFKGIGVNSYGHSLGHTSPKTKHWVNIHQHNTKMLVTLIKKLESTPEGTGTMMDNTLIVYTSSNANYQHTKGNNWPYVLIGDWGGKLSTGHYFDFSKTKRPINALYATLLEAAGKKVDHFNMSAAIRKSHDPGTGSLEELLG